MSERWSERRAYAAWLIVGLVAWITIVAGGLVTWRGAR